MNFIKTISLFALLFCFHQMQAQRYKNAIGVRVDNGLGITYQQYIDNDWTVEGIIHAPILRKDELGLTVLAEKHQKLVFRGANLYAGGGGHYYIKSNSNASSDSTSSNVIGITGIAGAEISFGKLNISADWKPELHLAGDQTKPFEWTGAAISIRYIIEKRDRPRIFKKKDKKKKKGSSEPGKMRKAWDKFKEKVGG